MMRSERESDGFAAHSAIRRFLTRLENLPGRAQCPDDVRAAIARVRRGGDDSDVAEMAAFFHGKSVNEISSRLADLDSFPGLAYLPDVAYWYYLPAIMEHSLRRPDEYNCVGTILNRLMPPPDNRKRDRLVVYAERIRTAPVGRPALFCDYLSLILDHEDLFPFDHCDAQKCYDRFWKHYAPWRDP